MTDSLDGAAVDEVGGDSSPPDNGSGEGLVGELSDLERRALELVASGATHADASAEVHRQAKWMQRLLRRPEARTYVQQRRAALLDETTGLLCEAARTGAKVLLAEMAGGEAGPRIRSASAALRFWDPLRQTAIEATEISELRHEIERMRALLEGEQ